MTADSSAVKLGPAETGSIVPLPLREVAAPHRAFYYSQCDLYALFPGGG